MRRIAIFFFRKRYKSAQSFKRYHGLISKVQSIHCYKKSNKNVYNNLWAINYSKCKNLDLYLLIAYSRYVILSNK